MYFFWLVFLFFVLLKHAPPPPAALTRPAGSTLWEQMWRGEMDCDGRDQHRHRHQHTNTTNTAHRRALDGLGNGVFWLAGWLDGFTVLVAGIIGVVVAAVVVGSVI